MNPVIYLQVPMRAFSSLIVSVGDVYVYFKLMIVRPISPEVKLAPSSTVAGREIPTRYIMAIQPPNTPTIRPPCFYPTCHTFECSHQGYRNTTKAERRVNEALGLKYVKILILTRGAFVKFSHPDGMSAKEIEGMCNCGVRRII
jgi:hypothetical protein